MTDNVRPCPCCNQKIKTKKGKRSVAIYIKSQQAKIKKLEEEMKRLTNLKTQPQKCTMYTTTPDKIKTTDRQSKIENGSGLQRLSPMMVTMSKSDYKELKATDDLLNGSHTPGKTMYSAKRKKYKKFKEMQIVLGFIHIKTDADIRMVYAAMHKKQSDKKSNAQCRSGRAGVSHTHKATKKVRYCVECCEKCASTHIKKIRPKNRLELELKDNINSKDDSSWVECTAHTAEQGICQECGHTTTAAVRLVVVVPAEQGICQECGHTTIAKWTLIEGTIFGKHLLSLIMYMASKKNTDEDVAEHITTVFRRTVKANSIWNARKVIAELLEKTMQYIMDVLKAAGYVAMDESRFGKAYAWLARTNIATLLKIVDTRKATVLYKLFPELEGKIAVVDGYTAYTKFFDEIQRCFSHLLLDAEKVAIQAGLGSKYDHLSDDLHQLYHNAKIVVFTSDAISESTCQEFITKFLNIAEEYGDHPMGTKLKNAAENTFTFLNHHDMESTNNSTETDVRRTVVIQRNFRHKLNSELGNGSMATFTVLQVVVKK